MGKHYQLLHGPLLGGLCFGGLAFAQIPENIGAGRLPCGMLAMGIDDPSHLSTRLRVHLGTDRRCPPRIARRHECHLPRSDLDHGDGLPLHHRDHHRLAAAVGSHRRHGPVHLHRRLLRRNQRDGLLPDQPLSRLTDHHGGGDHLPRRLPSRPSAAHRPPDQDTRPEQLYLTAGAANMKKPWLEHYAKHVPRTIAYPEIPIHRFLTDTVAAHPDDIAYTFNDTDTSYRELNLKVNKFALLLRRAGMKKG
ncbi:MAG: AMP-binding protein, partial [Deltaproteobacteria bacterium]|nr:AMP-binding protein [Deltaproteobacteria bacterium]